MILVYLLFCILIGLINNKTNVIFALLLGIFGLNFLLNGNQIIPAIQSLIAIPKVMLTSPTAILLVAIIILVFILSNLLNLINLDFIIDRWIGRFSTRKQQVIVFFVSFFSTNLDLSNSDIRVHHKNVYDINSGILPFINPVSIVVIFISTLLVMFDNVNGLEVTTVGFIVLLNVPALWWAFKTMVHLAYNHDVEYKINNFNMNLVRPSIDVQQSLIVQQSLRGRRFLRMLALLLIPSIIPAIIIPKNKVFVYIISYLILLIGYAIYLGVKAVYEERIMAEEEIYRTIRNSVLGIGPELISFLLTMIFTSLSYDYINRFYANNYNIEQLYLLAIIGLLIGMILFKDYIIGIAMALPITLVWITSNYAIESDAIEVLYISIISIATLIQILYLIDFRKATKALVVDISILIFVTCTIMVMGYMYGRTAGFTLFVVYALVYIMVFMFRSNRSQNDNIRHS